MDHTCYYGAAGVTPGFDRAYINTTRNGVDMLRLGLLLLAGLEAPDMELHKQLLRALRSKKG